MTQITRSGSTMERSVRIDRVFLRNRLLKTYGKNFISPPASARP